MKNISWMMNRCITDHPRVWLEIIPAHIVLHTHKTGVNNLAFFALNETFVLQVKIRQLLSIFFNS